MPRRTRSLESAQLISEKILQRYVFEKLSQSSRTRRLLLPGRLQPYASKFRVLIPEYRLPHSEHRPDFRIIFTEGPSQNIEVEWATSRFNHGSEVAGTEYAGGNGFLIVLQNDQDRAKPYMSGIDVVQIDIEEFLWWFAKHGPRLLGATMAIHTDKYRVRGRKYWVIYVGKGGGAQVDYIDKGRPNGIWAFRYAQGKAFENIISIIRGDIVIFATGWKVPNGRQIFPAWGWSTSHVDVFEVTDGYWCDYSDSTFESPLWDSRPESKQYMHYFAFSNAADSEYLFSKGMLQGSQFQTKDEDDAEICKAFLMSNTQRGSPYELSESAFRKLLLHLNSLTRMVQVVRR